MPLEIAIDNPADAVLAARHADRLELCSALDRHGMTPSDELVASVVAGVPIPVFALIRERDHYAADRAALDAMRTSARRIASAGVHGIVIGVLARDGRIDSAACREIIAAARSAKPDIQVAFHRAFDAAADVSAALDALADLGVAHTLCAGAPGLGLSSRPMIDRLAAIAHARDLTAARLNIVACGGVRSSNAAEFAVASGAWVHSSCRVSGRFDESQAAALALLLR